MKFLPLTLAGGVLLAIGSVSAHAGTTTQPGFYGAVGYSSLQPRNNGGTLAGNMDTRVNDNARPTLTLGYRFDDHWSAEAWVPFTKFKHEVNVQGAPAATVKHLPVLLTAQYHYRVHDRVQPYFGLGYGVVSVTGEQTEGAFGGSKLNVKQGDGITAQFGVDVLATPHIFVRAEARYLHWNSKVALDGTTVGMVTVNPWIYSIGVGYRF